MTQKLADLPLIRITPDLPPFTHIGLDYFEPIEVKSGRSRVKRYGALFTCLASRAVHLEMAYSMDTDSCISALRRFICRRGQIKEIVSDNGTNCVGAERELKKALAHLSMNKIQDSINTKGIKWSFNPPYGSHHGGVWERLIRIIKKILYSITKEQTLNDECLQTALSEVEAVLNARPITVTSGDSKDPEPLTPNHLLLLKGKPILPTGLFSKQDSYYRRRWKQVQYHSDLFWKRWTQEYLPLMQERQK
jgi:transposase InsO family protein